MESTSRRRSINAHFVLVTPRKIHGPPRDGLEAEMELRALDSTELEVLTMFGNGNTTSEIGEALSMHKGVVQDHLRVATRKLGASNRVHAAVIATEMGLIKTWKRGR